MTPAFRVHSSPSFPLIGIFSGILVSFFLPSLGTAQAPSALEDRTFVSTGVVAFDPDFRLTPGQGFVVFDIRNDSPRTISHLFGWVFRYREGMKDPAGFILVNNPHQPATQVGGRAHRAGSVASWRFILQNTEPLEPDEKLTLRISPRSVFYRNVEPSPPTEENPAP